MALLARRNLFHDRIRFAVTLTWPTEVHGTRDPRRADPGKKNVRTDEPSEPVDKKILETLVGLGQYAHIWAVLAYTLI
jgi:hypothetical protein